MPLTEENEEAMENEQFQQLLRRLGVRPPASGQVNTSVMASAKHVVASLIWLHWVFVAEQSFSTCCEWGLLFVVELRLLAALASPVAHVHGL